MNSDSERFLEQLTPQQAPAGLRARVLDGVAQELTVPAPSRGSRWTVAGLAASVVFAIGLNVGLEKVQEARFAKIYGPEPVPRQVTESPPIVEKVAGAETAARVKQQYLSAVRNSVTSAAGFETYWLSMGIHVAGKE